MASKKHIFRRGPASFGGFLLLVFVGLVLVFAGSFTNLLVPARAFFVDLVAPFYQITDVASTLTEWGKDSSASRQELIDDRRRLEDENLILQRRVMTLASMQADNARMSQLLGASELVEERVLIAEVIGAPPDTETHRLIVNRGRVDGIFVGQPVVDSEGIFAQVIVAGDETSELILISDRKHAMPVEMLRTGARAIAVGTGDYDLLWLRNVATTMDIKVGDELVSSGLGENFPRGYPVGTVTSVEKNSASPFLDIRIKPKAGLQTSRQLLLLFSQKRQLGTDVSFRSNSLR